MTHDVGRKYCFFPFFKLDTIIFFFCWANIHFFANLYKKVRVKFKIHIMNFQIGTIQRKQFHYVLFLTRNATVLYKFFKLPISISHNGAMTKADNSRVKFC